MLNIRQAQQSFLSFRLSTRRLSTGSVNRLLAELKECSRRKDLLRGKEAHAEAIASGILSHDYVSSSLINMYAKCGSLGDAQKLFDTLIQRDVVHWNCLLQGYVENGNSERTLEMFEGMEGACAPNARTYVAALIAAASLGGKWLIKGKQIHSRAVMHEGCDTFVKNALIDMYAKSGTSMIHARGVFDSMDEHTVVSWNALLQGYVDHGDSQVALDLYEEQEGGGCCPDGRTYVALVSACADLAVKEASRWRYRCKWLEKGKAFHSEAVKDGSCDIFVKSKLVDMYANSGCMVHAKSTFDSMEFHDLVCWNVLLQGYVQNGEGEVALELFSEIEGTADSRTYLAAIGACTSLASSREGAAKWTWLEKGKAVHSQAMRCSICNSTYVGNALVSMYASCGKMVHAHCVFDSMIQHTTVSWNALLQGYVDNGAAETVLELYDALEEEGDEQVRPESRTYVAALTACGVLVAGSIRDAKLEKSHINSSKMSKMRWLEKGKTIHSKSVMNKCCDEFVEGILVNMYAKCGSMVHSQAVFDCMVQPDIVAWTGLIMGYIDSGENRQALRLLATMDASGVPQDSATFVAALMACGNLAWLDTGRAFHAEIRNWGLEQDPVVSSCLVELYGRCGSMEDAKQVFDSIQVKTVASWNSLLCGYSLQGSTQQAFEIFEKMQEADGVFPDGITFVHILNACRHAGLVERGRQMFQDMLPKYGVAPNVIHYTCMIDLLARANHLDEALRLAKQMPFEAGVVTWTTILSACRKWNNGAVGEVAYRALLQLDDKHAPAYVLMANIYGNQQALNLKT